MYTYTAELFPTNVRTVGLGLGSLGGGLGGIIAPYILTLQVRNLQISIVHVGTILKDSSG